jgi:hypothetical protein
MSRDPYSGLRVVQQPGSPPFYLTFVPARELLEWCDVPRAKGDYMAGYQRTLDPRRSGDVATYLRLSPSNIVPGAIIVAVDDDYIDVVDGGNGLCQLTVHEDDRDFETKLQELWGAFTTRLTDEELSSAGISYSSPPIAPITETAPDDGTPADEADFAEVLADVEADLAEEDEDDVSAFPSSYLASLAKELTEAVQDWDRLSGPRQDAIRSYIEGVSKPGLIIDGQHRVFGAQKVSEHDVNLPIVILPGLAFAEQVFQFYVLNSKARPLRPTELRRIVSTSLTNAEIDELYDRFRAAGVEADEARWTLLMNRRPDSPFQGRINFGYDEPGSIIPENVADQVVRGFMKMPQYRYKQLTQPLGDLWTDSEKRLSIFFWFWTAVRDVYSDVWAAAERRADDGGKHQLFTKVALLTLQSFVLDRFVTALPYRADTDAAPLSSKDEVARMVQSTLTNLPGEFFEREWKMKQIDTSEGRKQLYAFMEAVWNNQGKMHGNLGLFRG